MPSVRDASRLRSPAARLSCLTVRDYLGWFRITSAELDSDDDVVLSWRFDRNHVTTKNSSSTPTIATPSEGSQIGIALHGIDLAVLSNPVPRAVHP